MDNAEPTPEVPSTSSQHKQNRFFVGPMPGKVVNSQLGRTKPGRLQALYSTTSVNEVPDLSHAVKPYAFNFFLRGGGNAEHWGEAEEQNAIETMIKHFQETQWGKAIFGEQQQEIRQRTWVGGSFEIGSLLGMDIIHEPTGVRDGVSEHSGRKSKSSTELNEVPLSPVAESFTAAAGPPPAPLPESHERAGALENDEVESQGLVSATSSTALFKQPPKRVTSSGALKPILRTQSSPPMPLNALNLAVEDEALLPRPMPNSAPKLVHYSDVLNGDVVHAAPGPAPPEVVLERTGNAVVGTSAGATVSEEPSEELRWGDVVMRDRMLVRIMHTSLESVGTSFDEHQNRTTEKLRCDKWQEYLVVWRKDQIELYQDYYFRLHRLFVKSKDLAFLIPLKASRTYLSLYSFVDLSFCITCPSSQAGSTTFIRRGSLAIGPVTDGTLIIVCKVKDRTRALDWFWKLWRHLGGQIPQMLEVRNPSLDMRLKVVMPEGLLVETHETFTRRNIIKLCSDALRSIPDWEHVIQPRIEEGHSLELSWRLDTNLDWIWHDESVDGKERNWAVLCGLALRQKACVPYLEIRLAEHFPRTVYTKDGTRIQEPPGIEGYVDMIRPNSQARQQVYLATHDGNLFYLSPSSAYPPSPPGLHPPPASGSTMRQIEVQRGAMQILRSFGITDLREIMVVRRAFQSIPQAMHTEQIPKTDDDFTRLWAQSSPESSPSDDDDPGGDEAITRIGNMRMRRSFELLLKTGQIIRFEAYSRRVALEWIDRLRALIAYWRQRHEVDAREEMDVVQGYRSRITPLTPACRGKHEVPDVPTSLLESMPTLSSIYHWCAMKGCKPIVKGGKLHTRRGLYGAYRLVQLFLVSGSLIEFHITPESGVHKQESKVINLLDAYICSGYFAARALPRGQYNPNIAPTPRRYQDGLETDDLEEDTIFTVLYRKKAPFVDTTLFGSDHAVGVSHERAHRLASKRKLVIYRTRSRFERDVWCWALNCEIEKMVRMTRAREERLRENGRLKEL